MTQPSATERTLEHYERQASTYDDLWSYDPDYVPRFTRAMSDALRLTRSDVIADVGCGTGLYTRRLLADVEPVHPVLCVDPAPAMLDRLPASPGLSPVLARAEDLASGEVVLPAGPLDAILLKESIHHAVSPRETLHGLAGLLSRRGRILVAMLPRDLTHPLFPAAHERFRALQPDPDEIAGFLTEAGLRASVSLRTFHVVIERERYIHMLESRYMSVLGDFSDRELEDGIRHFRQAYRDPVLRFDDHFTFVTGRMPPH